MAAPQIQTKKYTFEEYLELEKTSVLKHEFYYGEIFSMAGTTKIHNEIAINTTFVLKNNLKKKKKNCKVYLEAVKVQITEKNHYTYPDVVVSCDENEDDPLSIKYPIVIVEVLSDSTRQYDKDQKFQFYKQIPTLKHYILIEQNICFVNCYTKNNDLWNHHSYSKMEDVIKLSHLEVDIPVKEIYEDIKFENIPKFPFIFKE